MAEKIANKSGSTETWDTAAVKVTEGNKEKATPYELRPWAGCSITGLSEAGADKINGGERELNLHILLHSEIHRYEARDYQTTHSSFHFLNSF